MLLNRLKRISPTTRSLPTWGCYVLSDARYYVTAHSTTVSIQIVCDLDRMTIVACIPEKNQFFSLEYSNQFLPSVEPCMCCSGILDLSKEGRRWDGMVYNGIPYGLGTLYDDEGKREYSGFLMGDIKVCYGMEYYSDIEKPMYEGPFCSGVHCGEGTLWDRQGSVIHSGFFAGDPILNPIKKSQIETSDSCFHCQSLKAESRIVFIVTNQTQPTWRNVSILMNSLVCFDTQMYVKWSLITKTPNSSS